MNTQHVTKGIVLKRTDYGEADRILTLLTPTHGKLRLMARGVRKVKSKLAGGIELFSVSDLTFMRGRGDIGTLVSARLDTHYGHIIEHIDRTMAGYELIKQLDKATEDEPEAEYFQLLQTALTSLDNAAIPLELIRLWFGAQLLRLSGHTPNLTHESDGTKLQADKMYEFSFDDVSFTGKDRAPYTSDHIKFLRLLFSATQPAALAKISGVRELTEQVRPLVVFMRQQFHVV